MSHQSATQFRRSSPKNASTETEQEETAEETDICPECGGNVVASSESGFEERACEDCGLIEETSTIDHGPEWRAYNATEREQKRRTGPSTETPLYEGSMTTNISWQDQDAKGNALSDDQRIRMSRLRQRNRMFKQKDGAESLQTALGEINRMGSALGVSKSTRETGAVIYRRAREEDLIIGRTIEALAAGALYAALRMGGYPQTLKKVQSVSRSPSQRKVYRAYTLLQREFGLEIRPESPSQYISQIRSELGVPLVYETEAKDLIEAIDPVKLSGHNPTISAAAALYAAGITHPELPLLRQIDIADAADCQEVSVRNSYFDFVAASPRTQMDREELIAAARSEQAGDTGHISKKRLPGPYRTSEVLHPGVEIHQFTDDGGSEHIPDRLLRPSEK